MPRHISPVVVACLMTYAMLSPVGQAAAATPRDSAGTIGVVPPQDPTQFCRPLLHQEIDSIDYCRAQEGVGPMILPTNFDSLTPQEQSLVVFNLERVNRGLPPVVGLSASLNTYAQDGADRNDDPGFPSNEGDGGGAIWDANSTVVGSDDAYMYTDDCTPSNVVGCWGHRDNILMDGNSTDPLDGGAGFTAHGYNAQLNSYTFEFIYAYPQDDLVFTWQDELQYFATPPGIEPIQPPTITSVAPAAVSTNGGSTFTVTGTNLISAKEIDVDGVPAKQLDCQTESSCTATAPAHAPGPAGVQVTTVDGTTQASQQAQLSYAAPAMTRIGASRQAVRAGGVVRNPFEVRVTLGGSPAGGVAVTFKAPLNTYFNGGGGTRTVRTNAQGEARSPRLNADYVSSRTVTVRAMTKGAPTVQWRIRIKG